MIGPISSSFVSAHCQRYRSLFVIWLHYETKEKKNMRAAMSVAGSKVATSPRDLTRSFQSQPSPPVATLLWRGHTFASLTLRIELNLAPPLQRAEVRGSVGEGRSDGSV